MGHRQKLSLLCKILCISLILVGIYYILYWELKQTKPTVHSSQMSPMVIFEETLTSKRFHDFNDTLMKMAVDKIRDSMLTNDAKTKKVIYFYNSDYFHVFQEWVANTWGTSKVFEKCPVSSCIVAKGNMFLDTIDAIIFRPRDMEYCPKEKFPGQVWIFAEFESPSFYFIKKCFYEFKNKVNWTISYRRDADFPLAHGYFRKLKHNNFNQKQLDIIFAKKKQLAVAVISNCIAVSGRMQLIRKLQSLGVHIDIFGLCGNNKYVCNAGDRFTNIFNITGTSKPDICFGEFLEKYKFFMAFENSICLDYTTEKSLHRVMRYPIVPIIFDGSNASLFHPPHSYIHVSDFKRTKDLAEYIQNLDKDKNAYLEYLSWRKHYYTDDMHLEWNAAFCEICKRLHNPNNHRRLYRDIAAWHMSPGGRPACAPPK